MASSFVGMPPLAVGLTLCGRQGHTLFGQVLDKDVCDGGLEPKLLRGFSAKVS